MKGSCLFVTIRVTISLSVSFVALLLNISFLTIFPVCIVFSLGKYLIDSLNDTYILLENFPTILFDNPTDAVCSWRKIGL